MLTFQNRQTGGQADYNSIKHLKDGCILYRKFFVFGLNQEIEGISFQVEGY